VVPQQADAKGVSHFGLRKSRGFPGVLDAARKLEAVFLWCAHEFVR
jgi:hypothetical protein